jgi:hypothetical protein
MVTLNSDTIQLGSSIAVSLFWLIYLFRLQDFATLKYDSLKGYVLNGKSAANIMLTVLIIVLTAGVLLR